MEPFEILNLFTPLFALLVTLSFLLLLFILFVKFIAKIFAKAFFQEYNRLQELRLFKEKDDLTKKLS